MARRHVPEPIPELSMKNDVIIDLVSEIIINDLERKNQKHFNEEEHAHCRVNFTRIVGAYQEYLEGKDVFTS